MAALDDRRTLPPIRTEDAWASDTPIVFGEERALFGMLTLPPGGDVGNVGVVVCAPLGLENIFSYRPLRTLARRIADGGFPVLRFDWLGTGDSGELPSTVEGPALWRDAVHAAVDTLRDSTGVEEVAIVGLRIGATLGMLEAAANPLVSQVVLLDPYTDGGTYVRELRAFEGIADQVTHTDPAAALFALPEGSMEAGGFLLSAGELKALSSLDLNDASFWAYAPLRSLVVSSRAEGSAPRLAERLSERGTQVTRRVDDKLSCLWGIPAWSYLPASCGELVVDWLLENPQPQPRRAVRRADMPATLTMAAGAVIERASLIDTVRGRLFGITCSPASADAPSDDWVVFLNAGAIRRIGPHRLSTTWARKWAQSNVHSLRLDLYGIGESDGDPRRDEAILYDPAQVNHPDRLRDIRDALDWLEERHGARRFVLIGLCSGAVQAYRASLSDPRVVGAGMMNPAFVLDDQMHHMWVWEEARKLLTNPTRLLWYLRNKGLRRAPLSMQNGLRGGMLNLRGVTYRDKMLESFIRLRAENTELAAIFAAGDPSLDLVEQAIGPDFRSQLETIGMRIDIIQGVDHAFRQLWSHGVLEHFFERLLVSIGFLDGSAG